MLCPDRPWTNPGCPRIVIVRTDRLYRGVEIVAILLIDDAGLLRACRSAFVGGGIGASRETAVMAP
jgi:hypothetical protein